VRRLVPQSAAAPPPVVAPTVTLSAVNAASAQQGAVAPGEILTLYGSGLGPAAGVSASFDNGGALPVALSGTEVRFDGIAAPLFYTQAAQVNVQVPYGISGQSTTHVEAFYQGTSVGIVDLNVADAAPALFPVAFNQDGTINSAAAPAARGTIVTFFATGEGMTNGPNLTGLAAVAPYPSPKLPVSLTIGGIAADLLFGGSSPGLAGTMQVNARVPGAFLAPGRVPVQLQVGDQVSPALNMWIQ